MEADEVYSNHKLDKRDKVQSHIATTRQLRCRGTEKKKQTKQTVTTSKLKHKDILYLSVVNLGILEKDL